MTLGEAIEAVRNLPERSFSKPIDYSDIPELTEEQLSQFRRVGRPLLGSEPRKMISIKLDTELLKTIKGEAHKLGKPYQSLIHEVLEKRFKKKAA